MKTQGNFYFVDNHPIRLLLFCFLTFSSYAQTISSKVSLEQEIQRYEKKQRDAVKRFLDLGYKRIIETKEGDYSELVGENALGNPVYLLTSNNNVVTGLKADILHNGFDSFLMEGTGFRIGLWENGRPRGAHEMFRLTAPPATLQTRIEYALSQNNTATQRHATHVAGTLIGNQFSPSDTSPENALVRGVAFRSTIKAWDWLNVPEEMIAAATTDNIKIANTSFGLNPLYMHPAEFGRYNDIARLWDGVMCTNKEFQIVKSVGNARDDFKKNGYPEYPQVAALDGYDLLEGAGTAKNVLVVGSVHLDGAIQTNGSYNGSDTSGIGEAYSSWGPTDDGRIKPDLVTHGKSVFSSIETQNNKYGYYSGTSQAAAGVTGGITLLQEYWRNKYPSSGPMWSSTVRALLVHTVDEIDAKGPDYRYGWGVVNLPNAATTIKNRGRNVIIREDVLTSGVPIRMNLAATGAEDLKITIAWTDPAGTVVDINPLNPNASINEVTPKLVNDINIKLVRMDATGIEDTTLLDPNIPLGSNNVLFPWKMRDQIAGSSIGALAGLAERGVNDRDNIEKIEVYQNLIPTTGGMFQLQISHNGALTDACDVGQPFSLIVSGISFCDDNLVFQQNQDNELEDGVGTKVLANSIRASNIIEMIPLFQTVNDDFVEYQAKDFIDLLPVSQNGGTTNVNEGFTAEFGSDFLAHIDCNSDMNSREAFSPHEIASMIRDETVDDTIKIEKGQLVVYPNPFINDIINIQFSLLEDSTLKLYVYDTSGKLIFSDENQKIYPAGTNKKTIDLNQLPSGVYILQTKTIDGLRQIKLIKK